MRFDTNEYTELLKQVKNNHYNSANEYIRDCIFNKATVLEDYSAKQEICSSFDKLRKEMLTTEQKLDTYMLHCIDTNDSKEKFQEMIDEVKQQRINIEIQINNLLFKNYKKEKEIRELEENNHRKVE